MTELPAGYAEIPESERKKAKVFFDRGNTVAGTGNYEYAIEMYMSGLMIDPDAVDAHQNLRDISLKRKASGGKSLGFMDAMKLKKSVKDDKQNLLNSEKLLAYDPGNTDAMVSMLQNALRAGYYDTVMWVGPILQKANADSPKPDFSKFLILRDAYKGLEQWKLATDACNYAVLLRPDDMELQNELKNLGAMDTMKKGKYGKTGSFRDSVKDMEGQSKLLVQDKDVRTMDQMAGQIDDAEKEWQSDPTDNSKIMKYVEILVKTEQTEYENKAIDLLEEAYNRTKQFRFSQNVGKIRMSQMNRMERTLRQEVQANPSDPQARQDYQQFVLEKITEELEEYKRWVDAYPTDASFRFEVGYRMFQLQKYDDAIPVLQQVRQDPKLRTRASVLLGRSFLEAGFSNEAAETLGAVIAEYVHKGDKSSIEMTYWYGRSLELMGDNPAAIKAYSQVAQWDFKYKDVQERIKRLRAAAAAQ